MPTTVIVADDVLAAHPGRPLHVPPGAVVTPLARDIARERGITLDPSAPSAATGASPVTVGGEVGLEEKVRTIVAAMLGSVGEQTPNGKHPVKLTRQRLAVLSPFDQPGPGPNQRVHVGDVVTATDGSPMAAGYMTLTEGSFWWDFTYDEVQVVLEGELRLGGDGGDQVGYPGDIFFIPKGSRITFGTPSWTKFVYITFPADWGNQG